MIYRAFVKSFEEPQKSKRKIINFLTYIKSKQILERIIGLQELKKLF